MTLACPKPTTEYGALRLVGMTPKGQKSYSNHFNDGIALRLIFAIVTVALLLLLQFNKSLMYSSDDDDYFAVSTSIAYFNFPDYSDEFVPNEYQGKKLPTAAVGSGVLASPFVMVGAGLDTLTGAEISKKRTETNRGWTWSLLGFQISSLFYLLLGIVLLYISLRFYAKPINAFYATLISVLGGGGILVYVAIRPVMSHVYEFFSVSLLIYSFLKWKKQKYSTRQLNVFAISCALVTLTRYNNFPISLVAMTLVAGELFKEKKLTLKSVASVATIFLGLIFLFRFLPLFIMGFDARNLLYDGTPSQNLLNPVGYSELLSRISFILINPGMGLVFTATGVIFGMAVYFPQIFKNRIQPRWIFFFWLFSLVNFYIIINWRTFGSFYGYRYFVHTASPILAFPIAMFITKISSHSKKVLITIATTVIPVLSMFYWETSSAYTMSRFDPPNGVGYYDIPHDYHISLLTSFMDNPFSIFATRLKHGLLSNLVPQSHDLMSQHQVFFSEARTILYIIVFACFSLVSNKLIKFMRISDQK